MIVGIPAEIKPDEYRVSMTPAGVHELISHGHRVVVQKDAAAQVITAQKMLEANWSKTGGKSKPLTIERLMALLKREITGEPAGTAGSRRTSGTLATTMVIAGLSSRTARSWSPAPATTILPW